MSHFVVYARTSTRSQNLGIEAQLAIAERYVGSVSGEILAVYSEQESGKRDDRPELEKAIAHCTRSGATLLVARLDRLSRNVSFLFNLRDRLLSVGVQVVAANMPDVVRDTMTLGIFASLAQKEREMISQRTREALAAKKAQGAVLGNAKGCDMSKAQAAACEAVRANAEAWAAKVLPLVTLCKNKGSSLNEIARCLNDSGMTTRNGGRWTATTVRRVLARA